MKKIVYIAVLAVLAMTSASCSKFLTENPNGSLTDSNAFVDKDDAEALINSCYDGIQKGHDEYYIWYNLILSDCLADNAYAGGDDIAVINIFRRDIDPLNNVVMKSWKSLYGGILRTNVVLKMVPGIEDPALDQISFGEVTRRSEILAEASFLRALHYYNIVNIWGDAPLVLTTGSTAPEDVNVPRVSKEEIFAQIINDLEFAEANLPETRSTEARTRGLASKGAAEALLAKTYAVMGTPETTDWEKVKHYTDLVMKSGNYSLVPDFNHLYDGQHRNNRETILAVQYMGNGSPEGNYAPALLLPPSLTDQIWRKFLTPSHDLIKAYETAGDEIRKNATIIMEDINDVWYDEFYAEKVDGKWSTKEIPFPYKMRGNDRSGWDCSDLIYLLRYADIVLLNAEAVNQLNGPDAVASLPELQAIRTRAGLGQLTASSKADMVKKLLDERRLELAYEGQRFYDLKRYGMAVSTLSKTEWREIVNGKEGFFTKPFPAHYLNMPVPQSERDRNPELTQNEGYN